jgi:hypothetical protein
VDHLAHELDRDITTRTTVHPDGFIELEGHRYG